MVSKRTGEGDRDQVPFSDTAVRLGAAIKTRRMERGLTVYALAKTTGVSQEGLRKIELGLREPNWRTMVAVAEALDLSLDGLAAELKDLRNSEQPATAETKEPAKPSRPRKPEAPPAAKPAGKPRAKKGVAK